MNETDDDDENVFIARFSRVPRPPKAVKRERERLNEAYRALQQRPPSPRAVLEPLPGSSSQAQVARNEASAASAATHERLEFLENQVSLSVNKVGTRVENVEEMISSLGRVVMQCQKDVQLLDQQKRQLENQVRDSRQALEQEQVTRSEAGKDYLRLGYKIDTLSSELGAQKIEMQTFKSQLLGDSALLDKLREATGDTVQVTAEQIATLNKRVGDVMRNVQLLTQSFSEEVKERKALEQESRIQYTNAEAGLVQTESNILRRVLSVVEAQSKEILRKVSEGESLAEERHQVHRSALEEQWKLILNKEALEKKTIIERMLIMEKALREEHESRTYAERMLRDFVEQKNDEVGKVMETSRADVRDTIDYLRKQLVGTFQRMENLLSETDQATGTKVKELESIIKLEVQARMKAIRKLNTIWQDSFSEVNKLDSRILNVESTVQEIENNVMDIVVGEVADNLLETSVQELHFEDMDRKVSEMEDKVLKTKETILQEMDAMKDLAEVTKRRTETNLEQVRSELNLKITTYSLRFEELKAEVDKLKAHDPTKDIEEIQKQKVRIAELSAKVDEMSARTAEKVEEINERTAVSAQNVEDMDSKVEAMSAKILEMRNLQLLEFDSLKDLQDVSKKRQDNAIDQIRSEYNLNKVTNQLRMDELKQKMEDMGKRIEELLAEDSLPYGPEPEPEPEPEPAAEDPPEEAQRAEVEEVEDDDDDDDYEEEEEEEEEEEPVQEEEPPKQEEPEPEPEEEQLSPQELLQRLGQPQAEELEERD